VIGGEHAGKWGGQKISLLRGAKKQKENADESGGIKDCGMKFPRRRTSEKEKCSIPAQKRRGLIIERVEKVAHQGGVKCHVGVPL